MYDTVSTYSCSSKKIDFVDLEKKIPPINIKVIAKGLDIYVFWFLDNYVSNRSGCMVALRDQAYYVPGLPNYFCIISPQGIFTSEGYNVNFTDHCHYDHDIYAELKLKMHKPG